MANGVKATVDEIVKPFRIRAFIGDTPARTHLTSTKGHNSIFGCHKCDRESIYLNHRRVYSLRIKNLRTDDTFRNRENIQHHAVNYQHRPNVLEELGVGMVSQFPVEPMHLLDLGVTLAMLKNIKAGHCYGAAPTRQALAELSQRLIETAAFIPKEFARRPRTLQELPRWKATELRQFALYTGMVVLKNVVNQEIYDHFLHYVCAYRMLAAPGTCRENAPIADMLLQRFVEIYPHIYGADRVSYNVHGLLHLAAEVVRFGTIDSFEAYRYENYMQEMKKLVRKDNKILQQLFKRLSEMNSLNAETRNSGFIFRNHSNEPFPGCTSSYRGYQFDSFILQSNEKDCYCSVYPNEIIKISQFAEFHGRDVLIGRRFTISDLFFVYPMNSSDLGIIKVRGLSDQDEIFNIDQVMFKYFILHDVNDIVLVPILHNLQN